MTYNDYEYPQRTSAPIELFSFTDNTDTWRYVSGSESSFTFDGNVYTPALIARGKIRTTQDPSQDKIVVSVPTNLGIVSDNIGRFAKDKIYLKIVRIQNYDAANYANIFYGTVSGFNFSDQITEIYLESIAAAFNKRVVKEVATSLCRHILFGDQCGLAEASYKTAGTITLINGLAVSAAVFNTGTPDTYLSSVIITSDGERRVIVSDPGTGIVNIVRPFESATTGTTFHVTTKCDRTITGLCATASNTDNWGGFIFKGVNPYEKVVTTQERILVNPVQENT